jgi:hypothetical protein
LSYSDLLFDKQSGTGLFFAEKELAKFYVKLSLGISECYLVNGCFTKFESIILFKEGDTFCIFFLALFSIIFSIFINLFSFSEI